MKRRLMLLLSFATCLAWFRLAFAADATIPTNPADGITWKIVALAASTLLAGVMGYWARDMNRVVKDLAHRLDKLETEHQLYHCGNKKER